MTLVLKSWLPGCKKWLIKWYSNASIDRILPLHEFREDPEKDIFYFVENTYSTMSTEKKLRSNRFKRFIDAFSHRTKKTRKAVDNPVTEEATSESQQNIQKNEDVAANKKKRWLSKTFFYYATLTMAPEGVLYIGWMCIATLAVSYNLFAVPFRTTFPYQTSSNRHIWLSLDYLSDLIYIMDMLLIQTRIKYIQNGSLLTEYQDTKRYYLNQKAFKLDLISLTPLDILYIHFGLDATILRFPRLFKFQTFFAFCDLIDKMISSPHIIRIVRSFMIMMYIIHLNACAYYAYSLWEGIGTNEFVYNPGIVDTYLECFYFGLKTATGYGRTPTPVLVPQYVFMTFSWLMGVFGFAVLIGQARDTIATANRSEVEFRTVVDETMELMRCLNLSQTFQREVKTWFNYTWKTQHTLDENSVLDVLAPNTKTDIAMEVHIKSLMKVNLFADCDEALLRDLVLDLKSVIYLPGDLICKKGDVGKEMYIIQSGKVQVMGKDNNVVLATLSEGCVFGEISLLGIPGMSKRTADVRSFGYSNLFVLSKDDLNEALKYYPEAQAILNNKAQQLIKLNEEIERRNMLEEKEKQKAQKALEKSQGVSESNSSRSSKASTCRRNNEEKDSTFQTKATVHRSSN